MTSVLQADPVPVPDVSALVLCSAAALLLAACTTEARVIDSSPEDDAGPPDSVCTLGGPCLELDQTHIDKVDLLFVIDNSESMAEEQEALRAQFPRLLEHLTMGEDDDDGVQDFPAVSDLHLAVVSTDLGLPGVSGVPGCIGLGDDGILNRVPGEGVMSCQSSYPAFLSYIAGADDPEVTSNDLACLAALGTDGCGYEQQLEAALKALWPEVDIDPETGERIEPSRILFLGDQNGFGHFGNGDRENAGFVRNDPAAGPSVLSIVVVTDEEDCSSADTSHFTPAENLAADDPRRDQPMELRCHLNLGNLYPLERYINGLRAVHPGQEQRVLFTVIAGIPPELTTPMVREMYGLTRPDYRELYYEMVLSQLNAVISDGELRPSCSHPDLGDAFPPIRLTEVARGFGANGLLLSSCEPDLELSIDALVGHIGRHTGQACLDLEIFWPRQGLLECDVLWQLPPERMAPSGTPSTCDAPGFGFLSPDSRTARGGELCKVEQLPRQWDEVGNEGWFFDSSAGEGWYYDDFSDERAQQCRAFGQRRIAFTQGAKPPAGVRVYLDCSEAAVTSPEP